jgi:tetratricopeptide (TPR) repeat protein
MKNLLITLTVFSACALGPLSARADDADSRDAKKMYVKGYKKQINGNLKAAEKMFTDALLMSSSSETYFKRGTVRYEAGKMEEAIADFEKAISINPSYAEAYNYRGIVKLETGDTTEAMKDHEKAIELNPNYADAYYQRAYIKTHTGKFEDAIKDYDKAIDLNPEQGYMFLNRGYAYYLNKKYQKALLDANTAKYLMPNNPYVYKIKAITEIELGHYNNACKSIEEAIDLGYTETYGDDLEKLAKKNCR